MLKPDRPSTLRLEAGADNGRELAGARSFTAIGEWMADAPVEVMTALGVRRDPTEPSMAAADRIIPATSVRADQHRRPGSGRLLLAGWPGEPPRAALLTVPLTAAGWCASPGRRRQGTTRRT